MPTTSRGFPYPATSDAPNVPADIAALAEAVNDDIDGLAASLLPEQDEDSTSITPVTSTSFIPGSPVVQVTFVAPPSGRVKITVSASISQANNGNTGQVGWILRTGTVVGSGTIITDVANSRCVATSKAVNASGPAEITASNGPYLKASLTPGADYHVYTVHRTTPAGSVTVDHRRILVEPCH